ncbi:MAG: NADH-quinone oxidoreductase subunit NuoG [Deltaproteobacteria bacterium]|nr:NADH-quinone oxidoreductase subunit NuoG [Deltaproteobacteria bacterium]
MDKMVTLKVNGKEVTVKEGTLILDAAKEAGYHIPTFCYQENLSGVGSCRICLVEIEGQKKLQPSCVTPVMPDMSVKTDSATVVAARASMLEFLLSNHALDCPVCDKGGECELQDMVYKFGPRKGRFGEEKVRHHEKDYILSPVIIKNSNRCVSCMRCVRVCNEIVGRAVIGAVGRGAHQEMTSFLRSRLDCDHDGMCIEVCPVGCFMRLPYRYTARTWDLKGAKTVCPYCATGCAMAIEERDGTVVRAIARLGEGWNDRLLCARGRFGYDVLNSAERIKTPLLKVRGSFKPVSWDKALDIVRDRFTKADPQKLGGVASARLTDEELYLFQKLMRSVLNCGNIDSTSRWDDRAAAAFISEAGINAGGVTLYDCMNADTVFVMGGTISDENPVTDYIIRCTSAGRFMNVIIASTRAMKLDSSALLSVRHTPGRLGPLINAVVLSLYGDSRERLKGVEGIAAVKDSSVDELSGACGVQAAAIKAIAGKLRAASSVSLLVGTDFLRLKDGLSGLGLLKRALGALGKELKILPFLDRTNQRGAWDMGVHPLFGPGYREVEAGLGCHGMLDRAAGDGMDALYVIGTDIVGLYPDRGFAEDALSKIRFIVVQDTFMTETAEMADLVLPAASFGEKAGHITNQEGRVQKISALLKPPGEAKTDLEIIASIGSSISPGSMEGDPDAVFEEIIKEVEIYASAASSGEAGWLAGEAAAPVCGVMVKKGGSLREAMHRKAVEAGVPAGEAGSKPAADPDYPYYLVTGNHLFHSGRLSRRSGILKGLLMDPAVEISGSLAEELGIADGDRVEVRGRGYGARFFARIRKGSPRDVVFIAENFCEASVNRFFRRGETVPRVNITVLK